MTDRSDFLFELGCEELPPTQLRKLSEALTTHLCSGLQKAGLEHGTVHSYATPRRLALWIESLAHHQADQLIEKRGPAIKAAYTENGEPSKATLGFLRSCGEQITVDDLETLTTDKGSWLMFRQEQPGQSAQALLPDLILQSLSALPIAKRMRWGNRNDEFVRPVHWVVMLLDEAVVPTRILGIESGRTSRGHRFHANHEIEITSPNQYTELLKQQGRVLVDFDQRQTLIREQAEQAAENLQGQAHIEPDLLDEVTALVEWPIAVVGKIDQRYLALPKEALITTMQSNQKYFPVLDRNQELLPYFITISNIESCIPESVQQGNERVVRPRLADAEFFWEQDRKRALADYVDGLGDIVFQHKLGTLKAKTQRVEQLSTHLAEELGGNSELAVRAARLCKCDLTTQMVGEFASLQGIMGRYYALADNEPEEVARAIEEHYYPKQAGTILPSSTTGNIVAIADKIDTLVGIFSVGLIPTGDKDPYALRRAALGILRILVEQHIDLDLEKLVQITVQQFSHDFDAEQTTQQVLSFITERFRGYAISRGVSAEQFESVRRVAPLKPAEFDQRLQAVQEFMQLPESSNLCAANKRIQNLLRKSEVDPNQKLDTSILVEPAESALMSALDQAQITIQPKLKDRAYTDALRDLSQLDQPVNRFFDEILVMSDDQNLRQARLSLLQSLHQSFTQIADISVI